MDHYRLTATLGRQRRTHTIWAVDDTDATFAAIKHIMDAAYDDQDGPWSLGAITLRHGGRVVHEMAAKEVAS